MIEALISSKTRVKLLLKFFLNSNTSSYLRNLEEEFGESTNAIRLELNRLEKANMLTAQFVGNKKIFKANTTHPLFKDLHSIILKYVGLDKIIENVVNSLGELEKVYLTGDFAKGRDSTIIDLVFIGNVNKSYLLTLIEKAEGLIKRKIRFIVYSEQEFDLLKFGGSSNNSLLIWSN